MKLYQLFEKVIDVRTDLQFVKDRLKAVEGQLVDKNTSLARTLEILEDSFRPIGIYFERSNSSHSQDNIQHSVGLDGGGFNPDRGIIVVYLLRNIHEILDDQQTFAEFAKQFLILLGHELIHRQQQERSRVQLKSNDPSKMVEYLSQKEEIMAYAHQAAHELVIKFGRDSALISKLQDSKELSKLEQQSPALSLYLQNFEYDSPVRKRFLRYVTDYLK